ncbi:trans-sialidase [Trypanosoma cruzi cruzi]|nr:trans-sialidase [Trypanosoma cruzi cruzi]
MSRRVFDSAVLLLLVVMMCCSTGGAANVDVVEPSEPRFQWKDIPEGAGVTVDSLSVPGLLKVGSGVFFVAEAQLKDEKVFTGIASQILTMGKGNEPKEVLVDARDTIFLEKAPSPDAEKKVEVNRPTAVMEGSNIYMLVGKYNRNDVQESGAGDSGLLLVKGNVGGEENKKKIDWKSTESLPRGIFGTQLESLSQLILGGGSGVKMHDDTLVFPVEGAKKAAEEKDVKTVSLIISSSQDSTTWTLSNGMSDGGCSDPSVVEWKEKLMMMTACDGGRRRVYESGDKGDSWTEALGTLSRVWGNKQKGEEVKGVKSGFITAKIEENRDVMLVTLPVYAKAESEENGKEKGVLHLWLTDNTHIVDIGPVSDDDAAASSLLYKSGKDGDNNEEEELIALYEKKKGGEKETSSGMVSVPLTEQLERVKEVLKTWNEVDKRVSQLCPSENAREDPSPATACGAAIPTVGLVGFLSGNFSDNTWKDEYLGVNATVKKNDGVEKKENGVTFKGRGAWAEWPVGAQGENQLYHFANYNFTLVATVSTDKVPEEVAPISLMGVKTNGAENTVLLGLSYSNKEKKWMLLCGGGTKSEELSSPWEPETTHQVAIVLQNGTQGTAYVDGQRVGASCELGSTESQEISHFYIGGDGGSAGSREDISVTVTNVLLYNRPLSFAEMTALNTKLSISKQKDPQAVTGDTRAPEVREPPALVTVPQATLGVQEQGEQELLKTSKVADSHGVSTSTVLTATTSSGEEGSVKQLSSGIFPGGKENVDGGSSSNDDQTVGAEAGDTVRGDGPPQAPADTPATADANAPTTTGEEREGPAVNNSDACNMRGSGLLPSLLLLLGLWGFAAL